MIKPIGNGVVVKVEDKTETKTSSGIILRDATKNTVLNEGEVVASAEGNTSVVGDYVYFSKYKGIRFFEDDSDFVLIKDEDILAVK